MFYLKIDYSWGDEEPEQKFTSFDEAWESAKKMAMREVETVSTEHNGEVGISVQKNQTLEEGTISIHYLYDDTYCYYRIGHALEQKDLFSASTVYTDATELLKHLRFWCSGCGDLHYHGTRDITEDELPASLKHAYRELWSEGAGCLEYIAEYDGEYYLAIENEYPTDTDEDAVPGLFIGALLKASVLLVSNKGCRIVVGQETGPDNCNEVYFLIPADTEKSVFDKLEKEVISALYNE